MTLTDIWRHQFDAYLDEIRALFPTQSVMAEVFRVATADGQLATVALRPDRALALHIRLRPGEDIPGKVIQQLTPFIGSVTADEHPRLLHSRSAMSIPLHNGQGHLVGALHVESPIPSAFSADDITRVQSSSAYRRISAALSETAQLLVDEATLVADLIDIAIQQIFALADVDVAGAYYALLSVAIHLMHARDVIGAVTLVRQALFEEDLRLFTRVAAYGDFATPFPEWAVTDKSISRRAIEQRTPQRIPNVAADPDYLSNGERYRAGSELIIPLIDPELGESSGVIDLLSARPDAFTSDDEQQLERLAPALADIIARARRIDAGQLAQRQIEYGHRLRQQYPPLLPPPAATLAQMIADYHAVVEQRRALFADMLHNAAQASDADQSTLCLIETHASGLPEERNQPSYTLTRFVGDPLPQHPEDIWTSSTSAPHSLIGKVLADKSVLRVVRTPADLPSLARQFGDTHSAVVVPLMVQGSLRGVLNLEAHTEQHFTQQHLQWIRYVADEMTDALGTFEIAMLNRLTNIVKKLEAEANETVANMAGAPIDIVFLLRKTRRQAIAHALYDILHLDRALILIGFNVRQEDGSLNKKDGRILAVNTYPEQPDERENILEIDQGIVSYVFEKPEQQYFNSRRERENLPRPFYWDPDDGRDTIESGMVIPVLEGTRIIGALYLESSTPGIFSETIRNMVRDVANIISHVIVSARLQIEARQASLLRKTENVILQRSFTDTAAFARYIAQSACEIAALDRDDRYLVFGRLMLLRQLPSDPPGTQRVQEQYGMVRRNGQWEAETFAPSYELNVRNPIITHPVLRQVIQTQRGIMRVDPQTLDAGKTTDDGLVWPEAQSLLCVPLLRPIGQSKPENTVIGLLVIASNEPYSLNDSDLTMLRLFAQTVVLGLQSVAAEADRADLAEQMTHDFLKVLLPLQRRVHSFAAHLGALPVTNDAPLALAQETIQRDFTTIEQLIDLNRLLLNWFIDLTIENPAVAATQPEPVDLAVLVKDLEEPLNTFAEVVAGTRIAWEYPRSAIFIAAGGDLTETISRIDLLESAIFKYIENALKYGEPESIQVVITEEPKTVEFAVKNRGPLIEPSEIDLIFEKGYRGQRFSTDTIGSGLGLFLVQRIAAILGGTAAYRSEGADINVFTLTIPTFTPPTLKRG